MVPKPQLKLIYKKKVLEQTSLKWGEVWKTRSKFKIQKFDRKHFCQGQLDINTPVFSFWLWYGSGNETGTFWEDPKCVLVVKCMAGLVLGCLCWARAWPGCRLCAFKQRSARGRLGARSRGLCFGKHLPTQAWRDGEWSDWGLGQRRAFYTANSVMNERVEKHGDPWRCWCLVIL